MNRIGLGPEYFPLTAKGKPISNADIYIGNADTDPEIVGNRKTVYVQEEDGSITAVSQPINTGAGGVPLYDGSPVTLLVEGDYSLKVLDSQGDQIYYIPKNSIDLYNSSVDSLSDLRGYSSDGNFPVYVRAYATVGDGGEGIFEYFDGAAPGTYVDNDGTIIVPTGGDGSAAWLRQYSGAVNVRWFGAVESPGAGNDVGYIINQIFASLGGATRVYIPGSTKKWELSTTIITAQATIGSWCIIEGDGYISTTLEIPLSAAICGINCDTSDELTIRNLRIIEAVGTRVSACIAGGGTTLKVIDCWFGNSKYGIFQNKGAGSCYTNCVIENADYGGYISCNFDDGTISDLPTAAGGISDITVINGLFYSNQVHNFYVGRTGSNIINSIKFDACSFTDTSSDSGVLVEDSTGAGVSIGIQAVFTNCNFDENDSNGIRVDATRTALIGCNFRGNDATAIRANSASCRVISIGNIFDDDTGVQTNIYNVTNNAQILFGDYTETEIDYRNYYNADTVLSISANTTLTITDAKTVVASGLTAVRNIDMPTAADMKYIEYTIMNNDPEYRVNIRQSDAATLITTLHPGNWTRIISDGTNYYHNGLPPNLAGDTIIHNDDAVVNLTNNPERIHTTNDVLTSDRNYTLPALADCVRRDFIFKNLDATHDVLVIRNAADGGGTVATVDTNECYLVYNDGNEWYYIKSA
jgi:hypothetical protein